MKNTQEKLFDVTNVESFTKNGKFYSVVISKDNAKCDCGAFRNNRKEPCKHITSVAYENNIDLTSKFPRSESAVGFGKSLLKSAIQKAVRRGDHEKAVRCAKTLLEDDPVECTRRLAVIVLEDVILHPKYDKLVDTIKKLAKKDYRLTSDEKSLIISMVNDIAKTKWRDDFHDVINEDVGKGSYFMISEIAEEERKLVEAIVYRSKIGGMKSDVAMLKDHAMAWAFRFSSGKSNIDKLRRAFPEEKIKYSEVDFATESDILPEAVDFHCSPIINIIIKKEESKKLIESLYPGSDPADVLKRVIWKLRSAVSTKIKVTSKTPVDWFTAKDRTVYDNDRTKFVEIHERLREDMDAISMWFINKSKKTT